MSVAIIRHLLALRQQVTQWRQQGLSVGVVPTMGALHEGHLSLVRMALQQTDRVVVTIFVNPKQFNNPDDLASYPRTEHDDAAKLTPLGAHLIYCPDSTEIYPAGFATMVSVAGVSQGLCGANRAGHFDGVATVVTKLLLQSAADKAFFGEKDFQQLQVVRRLAIDLDLAVEIVGCPTVREDDGLAMSSRNSQLSTEQRAIAPAMAQALHAAGAQISAGKDVESTIARAHEAILRAGYRAVDYFELRSEDDLSPLTVLDRPGRLFAAAWLGETRLIDNIQVINQT